MSAPAPKVALNEACVRAAREVIAEKGVESLSMRDVARKLGVSHQAPYRHFASRDHLLAEIMRRCFTDFATFLDERGNHEDLDQDLGAMGIRYLEYAQLKPLEYRLMFGTPWPEPADHPALVQGAVHAFDVLRKLLVRKHAGRKDRDSRADLDALFIWSTLHGMASIRHADVMRHLVLSPGVAENFRDDVMQKMGQALIVPSPHKETAKVPSSVSRRRNQ